MTDPLPLTLVMPVLNEAAGIDAALRALAPLIARGVRVVVADGGSNDHTLAQAQRFDGVAVIQAPRGRAAQMNAGAACAADLAGARARAGRLASGAAQGSGNGVLLFLHADTALPPDADRLIAQALADGRHVWGRFDVRIAGRPWMLRMVAAFMNARSRWSGIATGDQALFMTRAAFDAVGGFPAQPLMEDIELSKRLRNLSRPACLRQRVTTSGRRWENHGVWPTIWLMWRLRWAYWRGASPQSLARRYE